MKAYVYTDKSLERFAGRFVWLSINTENAKNAGFLTKFRIPGLPTLLVLDPQGDTVLLRYLGGATVGQLTKILNDSSAKTVHVADEVLASAEKLAGAGKQKEAVTAYAAALANAPRNWKRYSRAAESYVGALGMSGQVERCATEARRLLARTSGTAALSIAASGLGCAAELDEKHPQRNDLAALFEKSMRAALDNPRLDISADDRSSIYIMLIGAREAAKDAAGEATLEREWVTFLENAAAKAKTPEQRTVYDSHRLSAYLEVGTPEKAIPMLEQSASDFPDDYNPHARLAAAYRAMKNYDQAIASADRALARAYGPRKLLIYRTKIDALVDQGNKEAARATLTEALEYAKSLPKPQQRDSTVAAFEKKLAELTP